MRRQRSVTKDKWKRQGKGATHASVVCSEGQQPVWNPLAQTRVHTMKINGNSWDEVNGEFGGVVTMLTKTQMAKQHTHTQLLHLHVCWRWSASTIAIFQLQDTLVVLVKVFDLCSGFSGDSRSDVGPFSSMNLHATAEPHHEHSEAGSHNHTLNSFTNSSRSNGVHFAMGACLTQNQPSQLPPRLVGDHAYRLLLTLPLLIVLCRARS